MGIFAALNRGRLADRLITAVALAGNSLPTYWIAIVAVVIFSVHLRWLPANGMHDITGSGGFIDLLRHLVLPCVALALALIGEQARILRTTVLEVINQPYVVVAKSKGLAPRIVTTRHVLRNAMVPFVALVGLQFGALLSGAVVIETVFAWPGLGFLMVQSLNQRDYTVVQAGVLFTAVIFVLSSLVADLISAYLSPQTRFS
ncbi:MAG TPA: ABC transporter permease [Pirellulales bacterium]|nr:ABC transporter permease [Pirellulales bacterium]